MKKVLGILAGIGGLILAPASVLAVGNYITLPDLFIEDCLAYVGSLFTDASLLIILAIGLPLGFWVIRKVISIVRAR